MRNTWLLLLFFQLPVWGFSQSQPSFWPEIQAFKKQDSLAFPQKGQVLLIGSSSFTLWKDAEAYFPGIPILNRAFGGSSLTHLIQYQEDIIFPYAPGQIVVYCGENDFAGNETLPSDSVVARFRQLFFSIRSSLPRVPVVYVSMKPSPARRHLMAKFDTANSAIRRFMHKQKKATYLDVYHAMLLPDGQPDPSLFLSDSLHMNASGYARWQKIMAPAVKKP